MAKKPINQIQRIIDCQRNFIAEVEKATETVPIIEKNLEWAEWAKKTVSKAPNNFDAPEIENYLSLIEDSIKSNLPDLSINPQVIVGTVGAANATLSGVIFDRINDRTFNVHNDFSWINQSKQDYYALQEKQNIVDEIANLLTKLDPKSEFLEAVDKYLKVASGIATHQDAATMMRNVLEGLKGELFEIVRKNGFVKQAKDSLRWEHISHLAINGIGSNQNKLLLKEKDRYDDVHSTLSLILKNEVVNPKDLLKEYYSKWLTLLYTVLNLIDPKYLS